MSENETQTEPRKRPRQPRHEDPAKILFVGGTGRSGTHIVSRVLVRNPEYALVPVECRFHVEENGFPGLLSGAVSKDQFIRRMRGFWWKGFQTNRMRGLHKFVEPELFDTALERFGDTFDDDPSEGCRNLFYDLLWHRAERKDAVGIIEQSCDVIAAAGTLAPLFPEARFIHVVRDGRDASASRVNQAKGLIYPRNRKQGLEWWEGRIRAIDRGSKEIERERYFEFGLDELLVDGRPRKRAVGRLTRFAGVYPSKPSRRFVNRRMSFDASNAARWREGLKQEEQRELVQQYKAILRGLDEDGVTCVPILRRSRKRLRRLSRERTKAAANGSQPGAEENVGG